MGRNSLVVCVTDVSGWVQAQRIEQLTRYLLEYRFEPMPSDEFARRWESGELSAVPVYFCSWRTVLGLEQGGSRFPAEAYEYFMTSVTSHYNIGGGLNLKAALKAGTDPHEAFEMAVRRLQQFKVVTANSRILYDLLRLRVPGLIYAPNGVDTECFAPPRPQPRAFDPSGIRVGWVGRVKAAKNYELVTALEEPLARLGVRLFRLAVERRPTGILARFRRRASRGTGRVLAPREMPRFYRDLDFYLCTSWHEGTPNPALEAASTGVPLVTTRVGNMPELVREGRDGFLVEPNRASILECFERLRKLSAEEYSALSDSIRNRIVAEWTWRKNAQGYRPALERLLSGA